MSRSQPAQNPADTALNLFRDGVGTMNDYEYLQMILAIIKEDPRQFSLRGFSLDTSLQYDPKILGKMGQSVRNPDGGGPGFHVRAVTSLLEGITERNINQSIRDIRDMIERVNWHSGQEQSFLVHNPELQRVCANIGGTLWSRGPIASTAQCEPTAGVPSTPTQNNNRQTPGR